MIVVVGCGSLGSHVAMMLRNLKEKLKLVDFDKVSAKNVEAQFHSKMGMGKYKAAALQQMLNGMFDRWVVAVIHKLTHDNAKELLGDSKLVIDCTDNLEARSIIQTYCRRMAIPCLHGATAADGTFARVVWSEHFKPDYEGEGEQHTCEDGEQLPFFCLVASHIAQEAQRFLKTGHRMSLHVTATGVMRVA